MRGVVGMGGWGLGGVGGGGLEVGGVGGMREGVGWVGGVGVVVEVERGGWSLVVGRGGVVVFGVGKVFLVVGVRVVRV